MASRAAVPQPHRQPRGEGVVNNGKQKKNLAAETRNRQALGDIGNLATVAGGNGKLQPQFSRPITRSFCAQLLAKAAKEATAAENNKKAICVNVVGAQREQVIVKPKPETVVELSPDTEGVKQEKPAENKKAICANVDGAQKKQVIVKPKPETVLELNPDAEGVKQEKLAENNKKAICANVDGAQKKQVIVKPKPETVIELRSNYKRETEEVKQEKPVNTRKTNKGSCRKKVQTMTSILTARSKVACGLINKPKERIVDIDAGDANNELAVVEYVEDIYRFYKLVESESHVRDYIKSQPEVEVSMRAILVDWLIEVHHKFELMPETLYLTINIVDRFLSVTTVPRRELQLLGIGAMLIASKYEEIWAPEVNDFVCISDRSYSHQQVLAMEKAILCRLEWTLTVPTPYVFLVRFIKASIPDQEMENMVYFYAELGLSNYATIMYCPSMLAASSVYAARCTLKKSPVWNETLKAHTGFSDEQLLGCAKLLAGYHSMASENKLIKAVYKKYSKPERSGVALHPPAGALLAATS